MNPPLLWMMQMQKKFLLYCRMLQKNLMPSLLIVTHDNRLTDVVKNQVTLDIQQVKTERS